MQTIDEAREHCRFVDGKIALVAQSGRLTIHNMAKIALVLALLVITPITCIHVDPSYSSNMYLQHIGTLLLMIPLLYDSVKNRMPMSAFVCMALFTLLHVVGARYVYSYVRYRELLVWLGVPADYWGVPAGYNGDLTKLTKFFGDYQTVLRNHYDRLIHFSFGLLMFPFLLHETRKWVERKPLTAVFVAWLLVQTGSMLYEIFEWQISVWSREGDTYNGQQGDVWDAQKDMLLAMIGSTIMAAFYAIWDKCKRKKMFAAVYAVVLLLCGLLVWVGTGGMRCSFEDCAKMLVKKAEQMHDHAEEEKCRAVLFLRDACNLNYADAEVKFEEIKKQLSRETDRARVRNVITIETVK